MMLYYGFYYGLDMKKVRCEPTFVTSLCNAICTHNTTNIIHDWIVSDVMTMSENSDYYYQEPEENGQITKKKKG